MEKKRKRKATEYKKINQADAIKMRNALNKKIELKKKKRKETLKLYFISILFVFILAIFIVCPKINLIGERIVELNYNEPYQEKGAKANFLGKDITERIKTTGNIDTSKIGTYKINYTLNISVFKFKGTRIIKVVDKIPPTITLIDEKDINICPGKEFEELGYKAYDEYDKDLTDKVKIKVTKDKIIYSVKDSSNNEYKITRNITKKDNNKPVITLKGSNTIYLTPDQKYKEPGYTAIDDCDKDITKKVKVTGDVKNGVLGTYKKTYEVRDIGGNLAKITRKIIVSEKTNPESGIIKKGAIYLTFDDGPSHSLTGKILDILKEEGVKATFFVTNNGTDSLIKRIYDEGHTIALHTYSHDYSVLYKSTDNYFEDLNKVSNRIKKITGYESKIIRFPGGSSNTISKKYNMGIMTTLTTEVLNRGYRYYDWNVDSNDAGNAKTSNDVYKNVTTSLSKNRANMVLMHDVKTTTKDALRDIIKYGKDNDYKFEKIEMDTYMVRQKVKN